MTGAKDSFQKTLFPYKKPQLSFFPTLDPSVPALCWHLLGTNLTAWVPQPLRHGTTYAFLLTGRECGYTHFEDWCFCRSSVCKLQSVESLTGCLICSEYFPFQSHVICNDKLKHSYLKNIQRGPVIWKWNIVLCPVFLDNLPSFFGFCWRHRALLRLWKASPPKGRGG